MLSIGTFIDIRARGSITLEAVSTSTLNTTDAIRTFGIGIAIVDAFLAFVDVGTFEAITSITVVTCTVI